MRGEGFDRLALPSGVIATVIVVLAALNYRGVLMTLNLNFVITALAFIAIIVLFFSVQPWSQGAVLKLGEMVTPDNALPYGWIGVIAGFHWGIWYYLGIEGTTQAAEEVRSPARSLPYGTMAGMITLLIGASITWYVCASLMPWQYLGFTYYPLFDAGKLTGSTLLEMMMFIGHHPCGTGIGQRLHQRCGARLVLARAVTATCRPGSRPCIRSIAHPTARSSSWCRSRWPSPSLPTSARRSPSRSCRACCTTPS